MKILGVVLLIMAVGAIIALIVRAAMDALLQLRAKRLDEYLGFARKQLAEGTPVKKTFMQAYQMLGQILPRISTCIRIVAEGEYYEGYALCVDPEKKIICPPLIFIERKSGRLLSLINGQVSEYDPADSVYAPHDILLAIERAIEPVMREIERQEAIGDEVADVYDEAVKTIPPI